MIRSLFAFSLLVLATPAHAQDGFSAAECATGAIQIDRRAYPAAQEAVLSAEAAKVPNGHGRLWQITAPGGQVSHLWSTYHTPHPALLDLPDAFRAILDKARVVAIEFDPTPADREEAARAFASDWMWLGMTDPVPDRSDIPADLMDRIGQRITAMGWYAEYLTQLTDAGLLSLLLSDPCDDFVAGFAQGQDNYIAQEGWLAGAEITGLQQPWELGAQLTDPSRAEQARAAVVVYASYLVPPGPGSRETAYSLYRQGRLAEMDLWADAGVAEVLGAAEARRVLDLTNAYLLVERNGFWVQTARPLLEEGGAVLAVGASHLPGDQGLVAMLRDAGYRVDRVVLPGEVP